MTDETMSAIDELAILKCLADETRLRMLLLISQEGELCVCELTSALNEGQSKVSRHLVAGCCQIGVKVSGCSMILPQVRHNGLFSY